MSDNTGNTGHKNPENPKKVLVVGGGIAGLTAASAFADHGASVRVVEIEPTWPTVGWGLSLTGPALRALDRLGLADRCIAAGFGINEVHSCGRDSQVLATQAMPRLLGPDRVAQAGIRRPALREILRTRAAESGVQLDSGLTVVALDERPTGGVRAEFSNVTAETYDLVIGADGVRSATRALIGVTATPEYTGQMVWRARVQRPEWADVLVTVADRGVSAGMIPISQDEAYVFHTENTPDPQPVPDSELADRLRGRLSGFTGRFADVILTILDPAAVVRRPVHVQLAQPPWHRGSIVLIGDAVHAPSPQMISGAAIAIEDAILLADLIADAPSDEVPAALDEFAARRYDRCAAVVAASIHMSRLERAGQHLESQAVQGRAFGALAAPF